ncbi:hypothetical protein Sipo8835_41510 [Streptomyces ipomoeae]|uniref:Uncharacterized protein n=1 Tax=Streptomyces ipomoeae TaxID=103232 RepID=A0AAE9AW95_9ACTN|nr:DUF6069 family protein [Streptomyces ipomoeae]TQE17871.1 hypothetical protein Sipo8835_41510 [Streptomyces ipomoeae]TQE29255.1 hypothetical protein Sipo7851_28890 [Streptomyces ipomoeae]
MSGSVSDALPSAPPAQRPRALIVVVGVLAAAVVALLGNAVVALLALAAGASGKLDALHPPAYAPLTVIGTVLGAVGWAAVRHFSKQPPRVLRWLVPVVVVVSFVPDLGLLSGSVPGGGPLAAVSLMVMHVVVAAVAVPTYRRVLPLQAG